MNSTSQIAEKIELELALSEGWAAAEYLDAADAGLLLVDSRRYMRCAVLLNKLIRAYPDLNMAERCGHSCALQELVENLQFEKSGGDSSVLKN